MPVVPVDRKYYTFSAGINTDASLINFPQNFSSDEENFLLDRDGSRVRRTGLKTIPSGDDIEDNELYQVFAPLAGGGFGAVEAPFACYRWEAYDSATGTQKNFLVVQDGAYLYVYDADVANPQGQIYHSAAELTNLTWFASVPGTLASDLGRVSMSTGWGKLYICEKHLKPLVLSWDSTLEEIEINEVEIYERDFVGIEDGIGLTVQPATLTESHEYNLTNRGWKLTDIEAYETANNQYPAKNQIPYFGYRRETTSGVAETDWTKAFSPEKMINELFQNMSAPVGHHIRSPFQTGFAKVRDESTAFQITTWTTSTTTTGATATITVTTDKAHGLSVSDKIWIEGQKSKYRISAVPKVLPVTGSLLDGEHTVVSAPSGTTFTFTITWPTFHSWKTQYLSMGSMYTTTTLATDVSVTTDFRPACTAWYAGRVWYAGVPTGALESKIFFSQVIETEEQYGLCYQRADPTDENINVLVATDGGVITIPEMRGVVKLMPHQGRMLVFAQNGVWEISGGQQGYFSADNYVVKKVTEAGCASGEGAVIAEDIPMFFAYDGIYAITYNPYTDRLEAKSVSAGKVDNLLKTLPVASKRLVYGAYDRRNKRVVWTYQSPEVQATTPSSKTTDMALVFDLRFEAFLKLRFWGTTVADNSTNCNVFGVYALENTDLEDPLIFWTRQYESYLTFGTRKYESVFCRFNIDELDYEDFGVGERSAYLVTGYDTLGDASRRKYPVYVTCYLKKTETGYTTSDSDLIPVGESSVKLQARWDWADKSAAGKWGPEREIYRHSRLYTPVDVNDNFDNGAPLVVTKNKVRGTGRSLHLKFTAGNNTPASILGWQVLYAGTTEV